MGLFNIVTNFIKDVPVVGDVVKGVTSFIDLVDDDDDDGKGRFGSLFKAGYAPIKPPKPPSIRAEGSTVPQRTAAVGPSLAAYRRYIEGTRGYKDLIRIARSEAGQPVGSGTSGKVPTVRGGTRRKLIPSSSKTLSV
jgi:hypothetical protein